ncbi:cache domain-containing sensor histidine kinase [Paenibacillus sp. FJAT-27812]|uniref:cache domain-containing sensor histidine kinase n=1 Tax=Paenibacillus sp. FJAT-27812 TaxID=1684143 RepID=UPI0006A7DF62|nr:histidine kinase [Paenibacillus sp. FJAT-27812]
MRFNSIRTKLIVFMLIATIVPIVTTMIVTYSYTAKSMKERALEDAQNLLYQGQRNVTAVLEELNLGSLNVYSDAELYRQLQTGLADFQTDSRVFAALSYMKSSVPAVHQVYLYASLGKRATIVTNVAGAKRASDIAPFPDLDAYVGSGESISLQPTHKSHTYGFSSLQPQQPSELVFTLHRRIERIPSSEKLGYVSMDVKLSLLTDIVGQLYDVGEEDLYVIDDNGYVVFADDERLLGKPLKASWFSGSLAAGGEESGHFEQGGALLVYERVQTEVAGWTIIKRIPTSYLIREANQAAAINLMLLALSLAVIVTATIVVSLRITAPVKQLVRYMNQVQAGNLNVPIQPSGNDEIGLVVVRFRSMMDTINNLILREYKLELANKTNQLRALQAQINPHFLNNTIQIIGTLALELGVPRIYALLSALARMMRYSMDNEASAITLRDELDHLKAYVELQKERYENRFVFHVDVDDRLMEAQMPKMILQPIIENYFKHGMDKSAEDGVLLLRAHEREDGLLAIIVENNGAAIPEGRLSELRRELASVAYSHREREDAPARGASGIEEQTKLAADNINRSLKLAQDDAEPKIGLNNVLARMKMVYGDEARLEIKNKEPQGVQITLLIKRTVDEGRTNDESTDRG